MSRLSTATPRIRCICSSTSTANRATAARRWSNLLEEYWKHGFDASASELPDYVPLFLEFLSLLPAEEAGGLLGDAVHVIAAIGRKLDKNGSHYATVFQVLEALSPVAAWNWPSRRCATWTRRWKCSVPRSTASSRCSSPARRSPWWPMPKSLRAGRRRLATALIQEDLKMSNLHNFLFGIYPYIALTIFLLGSLIRFDREQYSWKSDSSQLLARAQLRLGSNLFHIGILFLFFGHLAGLLTPHWLYESFGLSAPNKQMLAIVSGGTAGVLCFAGVAILLHRRLTEPRIRATSKPMDIFIMLWILATLLLGLVEHPVLAAASGRQRDAAAGRMGAAHRDLPRRRGRVAGRRVPIIYKIHLLFGMTLFVLFPFSRLVHVWSGFASSDLCRACLAARASARLKRCPNERGDEMTHVVIIGAGIAGVPAAYAIKASWAQGEGDGGLGQGLFSLRAIQSLDRHGLAQARRHRLSD